MSKKVNKKPLIASRKCKCCGRDTHHNVIKSDSKITYICSICGTQSFKNVVSKGE